MTGEGGIMKIMVLRHATLDIRQIADDILAGYDPKKGAELIKEISIYLDAIRDMTILGWTLPLDDGWKDTASYSEWQRWRKEQEAMQ